MTTVAFSPDGRWLASGDRDAIQLWDVTTGQEGRTLADGSYHLSWNGSRIAFSPDGRSLASIGSTLNPDKTETVKLWIWNVNTGELIRTVDTHVGFGPYVNSLAFSPDGRWLALGLSDLLLFDDNIGQMSTLVGSNLMAWGYSVAFSPDGRRLATAGNSLDLWDVGSGRIVKDRTPGNRGLIWAVAFSPDGKSLASGSRTLDLWDLATGQRTQLMDNCFKDQVNCDILSVGFSPDGRWLASGTMEGTLKLWNVRGIRLKSYF